MLTTVAALTAEIDREGRDQISTGAAGAPTCSTKRGYDPDFVSYHSGEGECSLTGIEVDCCPCGRHG